jgi:hypothetical protein
MLRSACIEVHMRSRFVARRHIRRCLGAAGIVSVLSSLPGAGPIALAQPRASLQNPDWPCRQILVGRVSLATVWSGPSIEGAAWQNDRAVSDIVAQLAARRTPLEDAERLVEKFAKAQGSDKTQKMIAVFAGLFETLNDERAQVIEGLLRFGSKQRELGAKIRAENSLPRERVTSEPSDTARQGMDISTDKLEWDLRVFDERRQSIAFVCEIPTLIEQRLFALARLIQHYLE